MQSLRDMDHPVNGLEPMDHEMDHLLTVIPTNEEMNWDIFELPGGRAVFPWPALPRQSLVRRRVGQGKDLSAYVCVGLRLTNHKGFRVSDLVAALRRCDMMGIEAWVFPWGGVKGYP